MSTSGSAAPKGGRRNFLITGCASGIGRHLAGEALTRGHRVLATDVDLESLAGHAAEAGWPEERARTEKLDVRDPDHWRRSIGIIESDWGSLDVLFNVAGMMNPGRVAEFTVEDVHNHFDVNVKGVIFGTRAAARRMVEKRAGHIVNVSSLASLAPIPGVSLYVASKYAIRAFSLAAAAELRHHGVAVTVVCPDAVATPMLEHQLDYPEAALTFTAFRVLTVEDMSKVIFGRVLRKRPLIVSIPRWRGWLARIADLWPSATRLMEPVMKRQGLRMQEALKKQLKRPPRAS